MTGFGRDSHPAGREHPATVLIARAWRDPAGFRVRVTTTDLPAQEPGTDPHEPGGADPGSVSVVVSSPGEVERLVRDWLRAYDAYD